MKIVAWLLGALFVGTIVLVPLALIWSVNTLFATEIAYTFKTWAAAAVLYTVLYSAVKPHSVSK